MGSVGISHRAYAWPARVHGLLTGRLIRIVDRFFDRIPLDPDKYDARFFRSSRGSAHLYPAGLLDSNGLLGRAMVRRGRWGKRVVVSGNLLGFRRHAWFIGSVPEKIGSFKAKPVPPCAHTGVRHCRHGGDQLGTAVVWVVDTRFLEHG